MNNLLNPPKPLKINGANYESIAKAADTLGLSPGTLQREFRKLGKSGMSSLEVVLSVKTKFKLEKVKDE